jgi:hypothetical protein
LIRLCRVKTRQHFFWDFLHIPGHGIPIDTGSHYDRNGAGNSPMFRDFAIAEEFFFWRDYLTFL